MLVLSKTVNTTYVYRLWYHLLILNSSMYFWSLVVLNWIRHLQNKILNSNINLFNNPIIDFCSTYWLKPIFLINPYVFLLLLAFDHVSLLTHSISLQEGTVEDRSLCMQFGVKIIQIQYCNIVLAFEHLVFFSNWDKRLNIWIVTF